MTKQDLRLAINAFPVVHQVQFKQTRGNAVRYVGNSHALLQMHSIQEQIPN